jgi:RNA polymerase sigma-70 factor, ECF subfamily
VTVVKPGTRDTRSDEELVEICNRGAGDQAVAAFESLYRRHKDFVLRVALRLTEDRELAADALQNVFVYLLNQFPPPGPGLALRARLTTYLYPIARNSTISLLRKARRIEGSGIEPDQLPAAAEPADAGDEFERLFASLPPERREILSLRFVDGLSLEEVASALEIPLGTVKSRLHLAIKALREHPATKNFFLK